MLETRFAYEIDTVDNGCVNYERELAKEEFSNIISRLLMLSSRYVETEVKNVEEANTFTLMFLSDDDGGLVTPGGEINI